ncbi:MAG: DUF5615 family PIN-like protein [Chloroflexi bacterium]|nr:DUF5615 family PIN-like protein [Chloroflexota bacterium]
MNFLANMGISPATVRFLRSMGHDAKHLHDENLDRLSDAEILEKARHENAIVLTNDLDFGELMAANQAQLPSVVIFRLTNMQAENVNAHLQQIIEHHSTDLEQGAILSVTERQVRVRQLPV